MTPEKVRTVAEGRVFNGQKAFQLGLVDKLGTLDDAIESAAGLAGLNEYTASYIRRPLTVKEEFLQIFSGSFTSTLTSMIPPALLRVFNRLLAPVTEIILLNDPKGLYAHCLIHDLSL